MMPTDTSTPQPTNGADPFADILGHERVREALSQAVASGRVHHAWLFSGREGIGKTLVARRFAQLLMCERSTPGGGAAALAACGECRHCRRIASDGHPDALHLAPEGRTIKIAQVRALQQKVGFRPFEARYRVVMVHQTQALGDAAANAMLKTLEEPGNETVFVLLTDQAHRLLPTIISRCQPVRFAPFRHDEIRGFLESREVASDKAALVSVLAEGSLSRALELAEEDLDEQLAVLDALSELRADDPGPVLVLAESIARDKERLPTMLTMLRAWYRDIMMLRGGAGEARVAMRWRLEQLRAQAAASSPEAIAGALDALTDIEDALRRNVNTTLAVERLLFRLVLER